MLLFTQRPDCSTCNISIYLLDLPFTYVTITFSMALNNLRIVECQHASTFPALDRNLQLAVSMAF